jgi:trk system potassium uptake protein TrkH
MTFASLMLLMVFGRVALRRRLVVQAETKTPSLHNIGQLVRAIVAFSLGTEAIVATVLTAWFVVRYGQPLGTAFYSGVFHAISAFNNAGFSLYSDSLSRYVTDPVVSLTIAAAVILGGLGYLVVFELARSWRRPSRWSVMTRVTVILTLALLALGTVIVLLSERGNPDTLGPLTGPQRLLAAFFHSAMTRTAGFNSVDVSAMRTETLFATDILMLIGGGSAGTAGGIKVTTFGVLAYIIWSALRAEPSVIIGRRRIPDSNQRQALAVALLSIGAVIAATVALLAMTGYDLDRVLFEVVSAFGTVGLSAGITADLPPAGVLLLVVLMFLGRLGPLTVASALAAQERSRRYDRPEERTVVG